ncbi:hypothetical protein [Rhizobium sp. SGZ-381]|uniref:hypothetical protein n=1 Tax=Rhizobium sp. SGZ-381 TaxID=3342800 RepID=UPI00366B8B74
MRYFHYLRQVLRLAWNALLWFLLLCGTIAGIVEMPEASSDPMLRGAHGFLGLALGYLLFLLRAHWPFIVIMMLLIAAIMYYHDTVVRRSRARFEKQKEKLIVKGVRRRPAHKWKRGRK